MIFFRFHPFITLASLVPQISDEAVHAGFLVPLERLRRLTLPLQHLMTRGVAKSFSDPGQPGFLKFSQFVVQAIQERMIPLRSRIMTCRAFSGQSRISIFQRNDQVLFLIFRCFQLTQDSGKEGFQAHLGGWLPLCLRIITEQSFDEVGRMVCWRHFCIQSLIDSFLRWIHCFLPFIR